MKMYIVSCGKMWIESSGLIAVESGTAEGETSQDTWVDIPVYTVLFDHPNGLVLFDTACDPEGMTKNWPEYNKKVSPYDAFESEMLPERLKQLGVAPEDIRYVVLSHLHTDHAGCLRLFKNAEVYVNETEFDETIKQYALSEMRPAYIASDIKGWLDAQLNWHLISPDKREVKLLDGLTIINFGPGHAFGMMGILAELENDGNYLLIADALYLAENMGPPVRLPGLLYDEAGYMATAGLISDYASTKRARILYGHDKQQFKDLVKSTEGYYY